MHQGRSNIQININMLERLDESQPVTNVKSCTRG